MGRFSRIPQSTFDNLQLDAGMVVKNLNPENPNIQDNDIVTATSGGVQIACTPKYSDLASDIDNAMEGIKECQHLDGWDISIAFTALNSNADTIQLALGAADKDPLNANKIIPRATLKNADFKDLFWIGDTSDGGYVAVKIMNALSSGGFSLKTTKNNKGQIAVTLKGYISIANQTQIPMEFYSYSGEDIAYYLVQQTLSNVTSTFTDNTVSSGAEVTATLAAVEGYTLANVVVLMGGEDITATAYDNGVVTIAAVTGDVQIIATATAE